mmetsp:Transcript_28097/g.47500  ORF Transcript_28097/g.47500 Transcript_28097/m.47500 type:complete len:474 (+) Transcript_28097:60-1481(+)
MSKSDPLRSGALFRLNEQAKERIRGRQPTESVRPTPSSLNGSSDLQRQVQAKFDALYRSTPNPMAALLGGGLTDSTGAGGLIQQQQMLQKQRQLQLLQQQRHQIRQQEQHQNIKRQGIGNTTYSQSSSPFRQSSAGANRGSTSSLSSPVENKAPATVTDERRELNYANPSFTAVEKTSTPVLTTTTVNTVARSKPTTPSVSSKPKKRIGVENISATISPKITTSISATAMTPTPNTSTQLKSSEPVPDMPDNPPAVMNAMSTGTGKSFRRGGNRSGKPPSSLTPQESGTSEPDLIPEKPKAKRRVQVVNISSTPVKKAEEPSTPVPSTTNSTSELHTRALNNNNRSKSPKISTKRPPTAVTSAPDEEQKQNGVTKKSNSKKSKKPPVAATIEQGNNKNTKKATVDKSNEALKSANKTDESPVKATKKRKSDGDVNIPQQSIETPAKSKKPRVSSSSSSSLLLLLAGALACSSC